MFGFIYLCFFLGFMFFKGAYAVDPPYNAPNCTKTYHVFNISESTPKRTVLLSTLSCTDADTGPEGTLKYRMIAGTAQFIVDEDTGQVKTKKRLNADYKKHFNAEIEVYDQGTPSLTSTVVIDVQVYSVNDNAPQIKGLLRTIFVRDSTAPGTLLTSCTLQDNDYPNGGLAGEVRLKKLSGGDPYKKFLVDHMNCNIFLHKQLFYEKQKQFDLKMVAYDLDPDFPRSSTQILTVIVQDSNTYPPTCVDYLKLVFLPESTEVGSSVTQFICSDKDTGVDGRLRYFAVGGDRDVFAVDRYNGTVYLMKTVDYESGLTDYTMDIMVRDDGNGQRFSITVEVKVVVTNSDDEDLKWTLASNFTTTIPEDTPTGTVILRPEAEDLDVVDDFTNQFIYGFEVPPSQPWFNINPGTGAIVVTSPLDRDTLSVVTFDIHAYSNNDPSIKIVAPVTITLTDINDEKPKFTQAVYTAIFPEHTAADTTVMTVTADDADEGVGGEVEYSIDGTFFNIDKTSGAVTITSTLDHADGLSHAARVTATDKGVTSLSSQSMVILTVSPVNDHAPVFNSVADKTIDEDMPPGTFVHQVAATDLDFGHDGEVSYSLQNASVPFFIDPKSGELYTRLGLDREVDATWDVVVVATDESKTSPKSSSVNVHFDIADVNDNVPVCDSVPTLTLSKPYSPGTNLKTLTCSDMDVGANKQLFFDIIGGDIDGIFSLSNDGDLLLAKSPTAISYSLVLKVNDGGGSPLSTSLPALVIVETGLSFTNIPISVDKDEDINIGDPVIKVEACCVFSTLIYEIVSGNSNGTFSIDQQSGQVYLLKGIDRENVDRYTIGVRARNTDSSQTVDSYFDLVVGDVNDNDPVFESTFTNISVVESLAQNSGIQTISATDRDDGTNGVLTYAITSGNTDNAFSIDSNGLLTLDKPLDAETLSFYALTITATDGGAISRTGEARVFVEVLNVDEHSPEIIGVTGIIDTDVNEDAALGSQLFKLEARDLDITSKLTYKITGGNDGHFVINGEFVHLVQLLDRETEDLHVLNIEVSNELDQKVTADLRITVKDVNDNDPVFSEAVYTFDMNDGSGTGSTVGPVTVTDADTGVNAQYDLTITSGNTGDVFEIVGSNIQTKTLIDYSLNVMYTLTIKAEDKGSSSRSSFTTVIISINPNLAVPEFGLNIQSLPLDENSADSSEIIDLDATKNGAKEADLIYSIRNGNTNNAFSIQRSSGKVFIAGNIDFEDVESYTLIIEAARKDTPSSTDSLTLEININNLNDNSPMFTQPMFQFSTTEGVSTGTPLGQVVVSDDDKGAFGQVTLNMLSSAGSADFSLDAGTGHLTVAATTEYSRQSRYYLTVVGSDGGSPALSASAILVVEVIDTNNHSPQFSQPEYHLGVIETVATNDEIYTVRATDADSGSNADVTYQIVSGNTAGKFSIDTITGALTVADGLDRDTEDNYILGIRATDTGVTPQSGNCILNITVVDVNDNSPTFSSSSVTQTVNRDTASGSIISSETATDADTGKNGDIIYAITSGNEEGIFLIGRTDGVLTMMSAPAKDIYTLTVTASDGGSPVKTGQLSVTVRVTPVTQPVVADLSFSVLENSPVNTPVGDVTPHPSHRAGSNVMYTITSGNFDSLFKIRRLGNGLGAITVDKSPDREVYEQYVITVNELDDDGLPIDRVVKITILDENDNSPAFSSSTINIRVVENSPVGHVVGTLTATDTDAGTNGEITYKIPSTYAIENEMFQIDINGALTVKKEPDFEVIPSFSFQVEATDGGGKSGQISVNLDVVDVDETIIEGEAEGISAFITTEVPDTATDGAVIATLTVADFGLKPADVSSVRFITVRTDEVLSVNEVSGVISVQNANQLVGNSRYYRLVICRVVDNNSGATVSVLGMIRTDCFIAVHHMIVITFGSTRDYIERYRGALRSHIQGFYRPEEKVVIWEVREESSTSRRRLLAAQSSVFLYALANGNINSLNTIQNDKLLLSQTSMLQPLQVSGDGTPVSGLSTAAFPVEQVMPYNVGETGASQEFATSPQGIAVIALAAAAALFLLIVIVACVVWRCKRSKRKSLDLTHSAENGVKKKRNSTAPKFRDIPPVAPTATVFPPLGSHSPPLKKTQGPLRAEFVKNTNDTKPIVKDSKTQSSKSPTKKKQLKAKNVPVPQKSSPIVDVDQEDNISTLGDGDNSSCDTGYHGDTTPTPHRKKSILKNEPLLVGGKLFDGVGYQEATNTAYIYNTKTGEVSRENISQASSPTPTCGTPRASPPPPPHTRNGSDVTEHIKPPVTPPIIERRGSLPTNLIPKHGTNKHLPATSKNGKMITLHGIQMTSTSDRHSGSLQDIRSVPRKPRSDLSGSIDSGINNHDDSNSSISDISYSSPASYRQRLLTHKLNRSVVSSIPAGRSNKKDILSRDPLYYDWAKNIAKRGKRPPPSDKTVIPGDVTSYLAKTATALPPHLARHKFGWLNNNDA